MKETVNIEAYYFAAYRTQQDGLEEVIFFRPEHVQTIEVKEQWREGGDFNRNTDIHITIRLQGCVLPELTTGCMVTKFERSIVYTSDEGITCDECDSVDSWRVTDKIDDAHEIAQAIMSTGSLMAKTIEEDE